MASFVDSTELVESISALLGATAAGGPGATACCCFLLGGMILLIYDFYRRIIAFLANYLKKL
jgi:hypothetical protein